MGDGSGEKISRRCSVGRATQRCGRARSIRARSACSPPGPPPLSGRAAAGSRDSAGAATPIHRPSPARAHLQDRRLRVQADGIDGVPGSIGLQQHVDGQAGVQLHKGGQLHLLQRTRSSRDGQMSARPRWRRRRPAAPEADRGGAPRPATQLLAPLQASQACPPTSWRSRGAGWAGAAACWAAATARAHRSRRARVGMVRESRGGCKAGER